MTKMTKMTRRQAELIVANMEGEMLSIEQEWELPQWVWELQEWNLEGSVEAQERMMGEMTEEAIEMARQIVGE